MGRYVNAHSQAVKVHLLGGRLVQPGEEVEIPADFEEFFSQRERPDAVTRSEAVAFDDNGSPIRVGFEHPHLKPAKAKPKAADKTEEV